MTGFTPRASRSPKRTGMTSSWRTRCWARPVTADHGGPVRLYVAPMYGYKSAKWLKSISLVQRAVPGFWEQQGYDIEAWVGDSNGRHDAPIS